MTCPERSRLSETKRLIQSRCSLREQNVLFAERKATYKSTKARVPWKKIEQPWATLESAVQTQNISQASCGHDDKHFPTPDNSFSHHAAGKRVDVDSQLDSTSLYCRGGDLEHWLIADDGLTQCVAGEKVDFETQIRPLLKQHCVSCHGPTLQKSGLRLDARSFFFKGGDGGRIVDEDSAANSEIVRRLRSGDEEDRMPPAGKPTLDADSIAVIEQWINEGAEWTETDEDRAAQVDKRRNHWAWQPIQDHQPPAGAEDLLPIDAWIRSRLVQDHLPSSERADRRTLIRRLAFDLTGLPPTPEQVAAFLKDESPDAWDRLVDEFLASPHYGERQARLWLDIAHYADTHGFERDQRRDNAWRYRDWVIEAFNSDMPYNQFLMDQVAGDVLRPDDGQAVIATGFLSAGPWDFVGQARLPVPFSNGWPVPMTWTT